jgi:hypothetical protein
MTLNTTDGSNGVSRGTPTSRVVFTYAGTYNFQWSGQFQNTDTQDHNANVWIRINGTDVVGSNGVVDVPAKHGSINGHTLAGWNFILTFAAGDYIELVWSSDSTQVSLQAYSAASPAPSTASLIVTAQQVMYTQLGPTGATGPTGVVAATAPVTYNSGTSTVGLNIGSSLTTSASNLIVDSTVVPYLGTANTFTGGVQQINAAASAIGLIVKANATTPGNIQEWQSSTGTILARIASDGTILSNSNVSATFFSASSATGGLAVQGTYALRFNGASNANFGTASPTGGVAQVQITNATTTAVGLIVKGAASQTANLQEWQNSAGTVQSRINSAGTFLVNGGSYIQSDGRTFINSSSAAFIPLTVRGTTSQTGNLQEWQDSSGTVLAKIGSGGVLGISGISSAAGTATRADFSGSANNLSLVAISAGSQPLIVKGAASQTANLTEWQDSSGGILTSIASTGFITSSSGIDITANSVFRARFTVGASAFSTLGQFVVVPFTGRVGMVVAPGASQVVDQMQYLNSAATVIGGRNALAQIYTGSTSPILVATGGATTAATGDGTTATITTTSAHGLAVGDLVTVAGVTPTGYNATALVTAVATNTISYLNATTGAQTVAGTVSVPAQSSITSRSAGTVGLMIKTAASQIADATQWINSSGTLLASVTSTGLIYSNSSSLGIWTVGRIAAGADLTSHLSVRSYADTQIQMIIRGAATQTADHLQNQKDSGTVVSGFNAAGQIYAGTTASVVGSTTTALTSAAYTSATVAVFTYGGTSLVQTGQRVTVAGVTGGTYNGTWTVSAVTSTTFTVLGSGFTNVAGSGGTVKLSAVGSFVSPTTATVGLVLQAIASQTANIFEAQDSTGAAQTRISSGGVLYSSQFAGLAGVSDTTGGGPFITMGATSATVSTRATTNIGLIVKGAASQTADLQQWQDSSANVLAKVTSAGNFVLNGVTISQSASSVTATNLGTSNNRVFLKEENSGGQLRLTKSTASAANNRATDLAQLYLRDGTTAGTLKLVIIAGTTGAETTILDNIPQ